MGWILDDAMDLFLDHVKLERGLAKNSVVAYGRDLARFRRYCEGAGITRAEAIEPRHLLAYLVELAGERLALRSQARMLVALRGLFKHLRAERHIARDPTGTRRRASASRRKRAHSSGLVSHSSRRNLMATPPPLRRSTPR